MQQDVDFRTESQLKRAQHFTWIPDLNVWRAITPRRRNGQPPEVFYATTLEKLGMKVAKYPCSNTSVW